MSWVGGTTAAPEQIICQRDDDGDRSTPPREPRCLEGIQETCGYYAGSCLYYLCCHAIDTVLLHIFCCRCLCLEYVHRAPEILDPRTRPQKVFTFCVKQLSNLGASAILVVIASQVFFQPFKLKPMLGACTINQFELQWPAATDPHLHFNLSTHLLFKNNIYLFYSIGYEHPAAAVFYAGEKLGPVDDEFRPFKQKICESNVVDQVTAGRLPNAGSNVIETFLRERVQGRFELVVRIRVTLTYIFWPFKGEYLTFFDCPLSSPVLQVGQPNMSPPALCNVVKI